MYYSNFIFLVGDDLSSVAAQQAQYLGVMENGMLFNYTESSRQNCAMVHLHLTGRTAIFSFTGAVEQHDDITIMVVQV
jgi:hypothetical protein